MPIFGPHIVFHTQTIILFHVDIRKFSATGPLAPPNFVFNILTIIEMSLQTRARGVNHSQVCGSNKSLVQTLIIGEPQAHGSD